MVISSLTSGCPAARALQIELLQTAITSLLDLERRSSADRSGVHVDNRDDSHLRENWVLGVMGDFA